MKAAFRKAPARGYTLIELTLAMAIGLMISALIMSMVNQQLAFLKIFRVQSFLVTEAPMLNNYVVKIVGNADSYLLYSKVDDLISGRPPITTGDAEAIMLRFKEPNGTFRSAVLSFENPGTGLGLYYRMVNSAGVLAAPSWALSKRPQRVRFLVDQGILRIRITGPADEEVTYSGTSQL